MPEVTEASEETVVRSLRRRLWHALQNDDLDEVEAAWTATRRHWEDWMHRSKNKKRAVFRRNNNNNKQPFVSTADRTHKILQLVLHPSEPFEMDDCGNPLQLEPERSSFFRKSPSSLVQQWPDGYAPTTLLHEVARLGNLRLLQSLLPQADVSVRNGHQRTLLHMVAGGGTTDPQGIVGKRSLPDNNNDRYLCLQTLLQHHQLSLNAIDSSGRTALHYASSLGRADLCHLLLEHPDTQLSIVDHNSQTPCELTKDPRLAARLEAQTLWTLEGPMVPAPMPRQHPFSWFQTWDRNRVLFERQGRLAEVQEVVAQLLPLLECGGKGALQAVFAHDDDDGNLEAIKAQLQQQQQPTSQTREDLAPLYHLHVTQWEQLLAFFRWDLQQAMTFFLKSPWETLDLAHVVVVPTTTSRNTLDEEEDDRMCLICCDDQVDEDEWKVLSSCGHGFCADCLAGYLADVAESHREQGLVIACPHHECEVLWAPQQVQDWADPVVYQQLLQNAAEKFVVDAQDLRYCPHPDCGMVVWFQRPASILKAGLEMESLNAANAVCTGQCVSPDIDPTTYEGVYDPNYLNCRTPTQPKQAHRFCFTCGMIPGHWPVSCDRILKWRGVIESHIQQVEGDGTTNFNELAHKLWLKANTRPCPYCRCPIEKDEGCNHMICPKCRYEFCWICRNDWKLHNTETGGFFRCNRWIEDGGETDPDIKKIQETMGTAMYDTHRQVKRSKDMARFLHHYERWNGHLQSANLERKMAETACSRFKPVVDAAVEFTGDADFDFDGLGLSFIHAAFAELLECRSILQHSYAFSYFRYGGVSTKRMKAVKRRMAEMKAFEEIQADLETMTEQMSNSIARAHLRASKGQIMYLTFAAAEKRKDFSNLMINVITLKRRERREADGGASEDAKSADTDDETRDDEKPRGGKKKSKHRRRPSGNYSDDHVEAASSAEVDESSPGVADYDSSIKLKHWACSACTYVNSGGKRCEICRSRRPTW